MNGLMPEPGWRHDCARVDVERDEGCRHQRDLRDAPAGLGVVRHADDRARRDPHGFPGIRRQRGLRELQARAGDLDVGAVRRLDLDLLRRRGQHHGRNQAIADRALAERVGDQVFAFVGVFRQLDPAFRAAVAVALVVGDHVAAHGRVGCVLLRLEDRGRHPDAARVGVVLELVDHLLAHQLRHIFGVHVEFLAARVDPQRFLQPLLVLGFGDVVQVAHALQDRLLAHPCPGRVPDRIVGRGVLRQAGQHGHFGDRQLVQVLVEIGASGAGKAVRALAQVDLVHVQLEDLVLGERGLDLVRERDLVQLARQVFFAGEEEVARHLHRDRRAAARAEAVAQVGDDGADAALEVDRAVLVETRVLDRQQRFLHQVGDLLDRDEIAVLLAELADQHVVRRVDAQGDLGAVVGHRIQRRDVRHDAQHDVTGNGGGAEQDDGQADQEESGDAGKARTRRLVGICQN
jgi:hypothetical protein